MGALQDAVAQLPGVGEESEKLLAKLGIRTIGDLLWHLPRRHIDFSQFVPLRLLRPDKEQTSEAVVGPIRERRTSRGQQITEVELLEKDGTPTGVTATWFGRQFIASKIRTGQRVRVSGKVAWFGRALQFRQPKIESADSDPVHTGRLVPVYPLTEGLKEGNLRRWLHTAVEGGPRRSPVVREVADPLPEAVRGRRALLALPDALKEVHFPSSDLTLQEGKRRLAFDELLTLQLGLALRRARWQRDANAPLLKVDDATLDGWIAALPFTLTGAQLGALADIRADLARRIPMSRLLEGDVGSGKTVVAALAARIAVASGTQVALMAPTELLAEQHHRTISTLFANGGPIVALLTSSVGAAQRREINEGLAAGTLDVVVGTHALVVETVQFARLGLAVVDEQHRFGVRQRTTLREKGTDPHLLLTTATPIPRTLTQTIYRDLDLSVIDELPVGRQEITTHVRTSKDLPKVWEGVRLAAGRGQQAFVVTPRIDPDPDDEEAAPSAVEAERELRTGALSGLRLALLHGRMAAKERDDTMRRFAAGEIDVLVATTVVEVGIDIPNATVMVILGAERFGLAQLHQLRGRVGRGSERAYCVLVSDAEDSERLAAMTERKDGRPLNGFELAEKDLAIRGAGEYLGDEQHGLSEMKIVDLADIDPRLQRETAEETDLILSRDPTLEAPEHAALAAAVAALWRRHGLA